MKANLRTFCDMICYQQLKDSGAVESSCVWSIQMTPVTSLKRILVEEIQINSYDDLSLFLNAKMQRR